MISKEKVSIGQEVFVLDRKTGKLFNAEVYDITTDGVALYRNHFVEMDGTKGPGCYGKTKADWVHVWETAEKAIEDLHGEVDALYEQYCAEITDVNELVKFASKHCFNGKEYTEEEAFAAYKDKAKEILGISL